MHSIRGSCVWFNYFGSLRPASLFPNPEKRFLPLLLMSFPSRRKIDGEKEEKIERKKKKKINTSFPVIEKNVTLLNLAGSIAEL